MPREFSLPGIEDLSKEQEDARALNKQGQHLIIGGPGTGKSVLALLRSHRHQQDNDDYFFLVYNNLLNQASKQLFGNELSSQQWQSWFIRTFYNETNNPMPKLEADRNGWQEFDWRGALEIIAAMPPYVEAIRPFLIIDEGQDMPPEFYLVLANLGFENIYVVADQNQQIVPGQNSTRNDIQNGLGLDPGDVIELRNNYRNTRAIARLAQAFYTGDPAAPPPELPHLPDISSNIRPLLFEYKIDKFQDLIKSILKNADTHPNKLFGIIAPNNDVRDKYFTALNNTEIEFDNDRPRITTYHYGGNQNIAFNDGGIVVINAMSCKGLEFDTVFLADINNHFCNNRNIDQVKRLFYVMVARAKEHVIMLKISDKHCPVDIILPQDTDILERK